MQSTNLIIATLDRLLFAARKEDSPSFRLVKRGGDGEQSRRDQMLVEKTRRNYSVPLGTEQVAYLRHAWNPFLFSTNILHIRRNVICLISKCPQFYPVPL